MSKAQIIVLEDAQSVHVRAAEEIVHFAGEAVCTHGEFSLCLAGGTTPAATYELMATRFHLSVDWKEVHFFWGDERCVAPAAEASNFAMANRTMLSRLALRPGQVHRIRGEAPPAEAAEAYEEELRSHFGLAQGEFPRFSLVMLGLGDNAHTLSLFPGLPAIHEQERLAIAVEVDAAQRSRVTLTAPTVNNAARAIFMATGEAKAVAVKHVLEGPRDVDLYPAQIIAPHDGELLWLLDRAAASLLTGV